MDPRRVLILTDDWVGLDDFCADLKRMGLDVSATYEPQEALGWTLGAKFDLAIVCLDYLIERESVQELRARNPGILLIVLSGAAQTRPTIDMVESLGGAVLRDRRISHSELQGLVLSFLDPGGFPGAKETIRRI